MVDLASLAAKFCTDKLQHGYIPFYEKHLPKEPKRILEIGVKEGRSLMMWSEYFPNTEMHGLDLFEENSIYDVCDNMGLPYDDYKGDKERFTFHQGNQCDYLLLEQLRKYDFDVIIDDGSHNSRDQLMTFFGLFNGKHYFIEDLHCTREGFYNQGLPYLYTADKLFERHDDGRYDVTYDNNIVVIKNIIHVG